MTKEQYVLQIDAIFKAAYMAICECTEVTDTFPCDCPENEKTKKGLSLIVAARTKAISDYENFNSTSRYANF